MCIIVYICVCRAAEWSDAGNKKGKNMSNAVNYYDTLNTFIKNLKRYSKRHGGDVVVHMVNVIDVQVERFGTCQGAEYYYYTSSTVHSVKTNKSRTYMTLEVTKYAKIPENDLYTEPEHKAMSYADAVKCNLLDVVNEV